VASAARAARQAHPFHRPGQPGESRGLSGASLQTQIDQARPIGILPTRISASSLFDQ
jgi:hypothetical protein